MGQEGRGEGCEGGILSGIQHLRLTSFCEIDPQSEFAVKVGYDSIAPIKAHTQAHTDTYIHTYSCIQTVTHTLTPG